MRKFFENRHAHWRLLGVISFSKLTVASIFRPRVSITAEMTREIGFPRVENTAN